MSLEKIPLTLVLARRPVGALQPAAPITSMAPSPEGRRLALLLIRVYQATISPLLGPCCRFHPSCSAYTAQCIGRFGAARRVGFPLAAARAAPVVLFRAEAALLAAIQAEPLDVLADEGGAAQTSGGGQAVSVVDALAAGKPDQAEQKALDHILQLGRDLESLLQIPGELIKAKEQQARH